MSTFDYDEIKKILFIEYKLDFIKISKKSGIPVKILKKLLYENKNHDCNVELNLLFRVAQGLNIPLDKFIKEDILCKVQFKKNGDQYNLEIPNWYPDRFDPIKRQEIVYYFCGGDGLNDIID